MERWIIKTINIPNTQENEQLLRKLTMMAARDGWKFNRIALEALKEYTVNHWQGNPQSLLELPVLKDEERRIVWQHCKYHGFAEGGKRYCGEKRKTDPDCLTCCVPKKVREAKK